MFLMDEREASVFLRVSRRTLQGWRVRGGGPVFLKLGKRVLYDRGALEQWLKSRSRQSTSDRGAAAN